MDRRQFMGGSGAAVLAALSSQSRAQHLAGRAFPGVDPEMVDDLAAVVEMEVGSGNLDRFRHRPATRPAHPVPALAQAPLTTVMVPGLAGQPTVRTLQLDGGAGVDGGRRERGAVVWMHGGGYVAGSASLPAALRVAAQEHGWLLVSVDYRLAPETRFPGSLDDNLAALAWVHANAGRLGIDPRRIAVGGSSAGGGHAAALALAARDRGGLPVAYQVLIYPMLDDRTGGSRPARPGTGRWIWTANSNRYGWTALLGVPAGSGQVPARAVPGRRSDLAGLPPAFVGVGTLDLFLDEDLAYATALTAAGVPVDLAVVPGAFHAFDGIAAGARASQAFTARWIAGLTAAIG